MTIFTDDIQILNDELNEAFMPAVGLKPVVKLFGETLYGSDKLNRKYVSIIEKQTMTKQYAPKIKSLVDKKDIIPCFMSKGILKLAIFKVFGTDMSKKSAIAFYAIKEDKIIILIDNQVTFLAFANDGMICETTIHEMMHMAAKRSGSKFLSTFKDPLFDYYSDYFQMLFQTKEKPDVNKYVTYLFNKIERNKSDGINLKGIYDKLQIFKPMTTLDDKTFDQYCVDYLVNIKLRYSNFNSWYNNRRKYSHVLNNLYRAYVDAFGSAFRRNNTIAIQELDVPSEVIAIMSEKKGKYSSLINQGVNLC